MGITLTHPLSLAAMALRFCRNAVAESFACDEPLSNLSADRGDSGMLMIGRFGFHLSYRGLQLPAPWRSILQSSESIRVFCYKGVKKSLAGSKARQPCLVHPFRVGLCLNARSCCD